MENILFSYFVKYSVKPHGLSVTLCLSGCHSSPVPGPCHGRCPRPPSPSSSEEDPLGTQEADHENLLETRDRGGNSLFLTLQLTQQCVNEQESHTPLLRGKIKQSTSKGPAPGLGGNASWQTQEKAQAAGWLPSHGDLERQRESRREKQFHLWNYTPLFSFILISTFKESKKKKRRNIASVRVMETFLLQSPFKVNLDVQRCIWFLLCG